MHFICIIISVGTDNALLKEQMGVSRNFFCGEDACLELEVQWDREKMDTMV